MVQMFPLNCLPSPICVLKHIRTRLIAAEGGIIFVGRDEVKKLVLKIDYHVTEKTRGG